jgi:hypothetical protein
MVCPFFLLVAFAVAFVARFVSHAGSPRLVWGSTPIINYAYWSKAMRAAGYYSETYTTSFYERINQRSDWDRILFEEYPRIPNRIKPLVAFVSSLIKYDVFFISFDGYFIGGWPFAFFQASILKFARKKVVVIAYGGDSYVYRRVRSTGTLHGLMMSYPLAAKRQTRVAHTVDYWCENANAVIPGIMGPDGFGRWDVLLHSSLAIDLDKWVVSKRASTADGWNGTVVISHSPNHRGFKGTEFLLAAIDQLRSEGLKVELQLLEGMQNSEVRRILSEETDILVEALICNGHGMSGLEGMASGLPTITNLEDDSYMLPVRRWSYFEECPLVSASPETITSVLRKLITRPDLRHTLSRASRAYVEKYHGLDSAAFLFGEVIQYVYGKRESLINLYHPLLGNYSHRLPRVDHPLVNSRIID